MAETYVTSTVTGAVLSDGSTMSGTWTTEYDDSGKIVRIFDSQFTVTGDGGTTTFTNGYVLSYANPASNGNYQITFPTVSGGSYDSLYVDWQGQNPSSLDSGSANIFTSVKNTAAGSENITLASPGTVQDTPATAPASFVLSTLTDAVFSDGTVLSGTWTTEYDASGAIVGITNAQFTATGPGGTTTFTNGYVLSYANPTSSGAYQITFPTVSGGSYDSLYVDWVGENPSSLDGGAGSNIYSSIKNTAVGTTPVTLTSSGSITDQAVTLVTSSISGAVFQDGTVLSGSWTAEYDSSGAIIAITNAHFTATGSGGTTSFTNGYVLSYANPASNGNYQITFPTQSGGSYTSLYVDWDGMYPTQLDAGSNNIFTSIKNSTTGDDAIHLASGGTPYDGAACFVAGTMIATPSGETPVEALSVGDLVLLADGTSQPVVWIGMRALEPRRHPRPETVQPVRIRAGALADGVPVRDLFVSPDHALLLDGMLVPAKVLVNGSTIAACDVESVRYFHVELETHAALLADGAPAESYLETGNRDAFQGGSGATILHPDLAQIVREVAGFAPFVETGAALEALRARLLERSGQTLTQEPELEIVMVPEGALIRSRAAVPAEITPVPADRRRLGVKIAALQVGDVAIPLDHPALVRGWHGLEPDGRWTDGAALVPASLLAGRTALDVTVAAVLAYPMQQAA